jgi:large subunit ribosomal protein L25
MNETFELHAEPRADVGKGASRRLRRADKVPAILYGANQTPEMLSLSHRELVKSLENPAIFSHILDLHIGDRRESVIFKDLQRHPAKPRLLHADFLRVSATQELQVQVPLHFINEETSPGVKAGGMISHHLIGVEISCLPANLPEYIEVDVGALEVGDAIHLTELQLPPGVELATAPDADHDEPVVSIHAKAAEEGAAEEGEAAAPAAEAGED